MAKDKSGYIIAAAFIGPGTVTTASLAGANFGFHLVWALLFSIFATIVLQDMAARLGVATGKGLASAMKDMVSTPWLKMLFIALIVSAIGIGNAAYESGNLTGAAIGLDAFWEIGTGTWALILGVLAIALLWTGSYSWIESVLVYLVFIMAGVFFVTLIVAKPDISLMFSQLLQPRLAADSITTILALIGTTIVPYNLFLHASLVAKSSTNTDNTNSDKSDAIKACRKQSATAISMGGLITLVVMATAMMAFFNQAATMDAGNMGEQLKPVLGDKAQWFFALGLFAAGLTSAITAPLAAAYAVCGALGLSDDMKSKGFRAVWLTIIVCGVAVAALGFKPLPAILFAQATNGLLLPIIAIFLLVVMNKSNALGEFKNTLWSNLAGVLVVSVVVGLGLYKLTSLFI
ncbi:Nramp family divalent metal transporter [Alteromonas naphthalenivorans]|jgi:NRAMP (natural resistance-associated macrophage protein)-like metal ion transporter|uniref:Manganese/divalent cation transport protein n=1 Tax=Alteromonas naphthalenivorans TaxID=715451 RepID=F5Z9L0_ALTNA|nr:Nramp family divalent metal transporter [Alteromonas naphthalenivorans]AEF01855.1 putative manganese/divalent cation transport protein [Alteromonas naphthalenivorans]|tara:strand:+ start:4614 stop:5825 length:1212 start_codon:yes stop_codon:yes gene_type:complete